jgi:hypothetical protein
MNISFPARIDVSYQEETLRNSIKINVLIQEVIIHTVVN